MERPSAAGGSFYLGYRISFIFQTEVVNPASVSGIIVWIVWESKEKNKYQKTKIPDKERPDSAWTKLVPSSLGRINSRPGAGAPL